LENGLQAKDTVVRFFDLIRTVERFVQFLEVGLAMFSDLF